MLTNFYGKPVSVVVKFVPPDQMQFGAAGTTNIDQTPEDRHIYNSEYGMNTVSIKIKSSIRSLTLLAHEFGHAIYQVRNLESYMEFSLREYVSSSFNSIYIGHKHHDPSGQMAFHYEKLFSKQFTHYMKNSEARMRDPLTILHHIGKNYDKET